jgi:glycosyltransferase involved in cell wall biosynthesis
MIDRDPVSVRFERAEPRPPLLRVRPAADGERIRVLRVISRLVIGGPTLHVAILCKGMDPDRFEQRLVAGRELAGERSLVDELTAQGLAPRILSEMIGESNPRLADLRALASLYRLMREYRPHVVHTHTGKAGILGRIAARLAAVPVVVHTFHGHVLHGYWGRFKTSAARNVERGLARLTSCLVAVSPEIERDLVRYRVASPEKIVVIPLGLSLEPFLAAESLRGGFRAEIGIPAEAPLVGIVGRIAPIKNHRLFLDAARTVLARRPAVRFVVVGDGELRARTEEQARRLGIADRIVFVGWRRDLPRICADLDLLAISSDNEGTPVSAIEAMAASRPVVSTRVGGVADLIADGETGRLVPPRDPAALASAILELLDDPRTAERLGRAARESVCERFTGARLVSEIEQLYVRLLSRPPSPERSPWPAPARAAADRGLVRQG